MIDEHVEDSTGTAGNSENSKVMSLDKAPTWVSLIGSMTAGGSVVYSEPEISTSMVLWEQIDQFLNAQLFLSIGGISVAVAALLLPRLLASTDRIDREGADLQPTAKLKLETRRLARIQRFLLSSFGLCLAGLVSCFAFDGVLEYQPSNEGVAPLFGFLGVWIDVAEGATSGVLLAGSLTCLVLALRLFFVAIGSALNYGRTGGPAKL